LAEEIDLGKSFSSPDEQQIKDSDSQFDQLDRLILFSRLGEFPAKVSRSSFVVPAQLETRNLKLYI